MFKKLREDLRQTLVYSKEFRIAAPSWWNLSDSLTIEDLNKLRSSSKTGDKMVNPGDKSLLNLAGEIGTTFWRLQRRVSSGGDVPQEIKKIRRDLESMEEALKQANIEVEDLTGQKYVDGMALKVLTRQPTPGLTDEIILETIKPTVYCNNNLIQRGEVILGVPEKNVDHSG